MTTGARSDLRILAEVIRDRLDDKAFVVKPAFKPHAKSFIAVQTKFASASALLDAAEQAKRDALDAELDVYAGVVSSAGLGTRVRPCKAFTKLRVSDVKALAYAKEVDTVREIVAAVARTSPPANVTKAGTACLAKAAAVEKGLKAYSKPATAYQKALEQRDALLPELQKAIKTLKTHAASAYADDPATVKALFAPPEAVQAPKLRRAPRKPKAGAAPKPVTNGAVTG